MQEFNIYQPSEEPYIKINAETKSGGLQPWVLFAGERLSDLISKKVTPISAIWINPPESSSAFFNNAGIPAGLVREIGETEGRCFIIGIAPIRNTELYEPSEDDLTFRVGSADIDGDPHEAIKLIRFLKKERVVSFVKRCEKINHELFITVSRQNAPSFCVEADKSDVFTILCDTEPDFKSKPQREAAFQLDDTPQAQMPWDSKKLSPSERVLLLLSSKELCSQRGLSETFDFSLGSVLAPYGGLSEIAPEQTAAVIVPAAGSKTAVLSAYFCNPDAEYSLSSVLTSTAKLIASGVAPDDVYSYVKPHISYAIGTAPASKALPSHFARRGSMIYLIETPLTRSGKPDIERLRILWEKFYGFVQGGLVLSASACEYGGAAGAMALMSLSGLCGTSHADFYSDTLFDSPPGSIIFESPHYIEGENLVGVVQQGVKFQLGDDYIPFDSLYAAWQLPFETKYPTEPPSSASARFNAVQQIKYHYRAKPPVRLLSAKPLVFAPVFPGATGEAAMLAALEAAGAAPEAPLIRTSTPDWQAASIVESAAALKRAHMCVLHGDESFITDFLRHELILETLLDLLNRRGGLVLGLSGGFAALLNLGLLPYGKISKTSIKFERNTIKRHCARFVHTRASSILSPWLMRCALGEIHSLPVSESFGKLSGDDSELEHLIANGQIAFQYSDAKGRTGNSAIINPLDSDYLIEGISSPDGRILGKIARPERTGLYFAKNVLGQKQQPIFEGGVRYFR